MEPIVGAIYEGEWSSLSGMYTTDEADFMAELLGNCAPNQIDSNSFWPNHDMEGVNECSFYCSNIGNANMYNSQGSGTSYNQESYYLSDSHPILFNNSNSMSMDFCIGDMTNTASYLIEGNDCSNQETSNGNNVEVSGGNHPEAAAAHSDDNLKPKMESEMPVLEPFQEDKSSNPSEKSKKRSRNSGDAQKNKRNVRSKKSQKNASTTNNDEESNGGGLNGPASSCCCSEDESNESQEIHGGASSSLSSKGTAPLNSSGKTRASRGAATDPQSLYARKRRERINERLRILQNLVPNGTKVDISTMLEEAVQYVKFLQLQIKLLSSDDLWMYAPIAYNGMDLGLDQHLAKVAAQRL